MQTQPHIVWKGVDSSPALAERIDRELGELEHIYQRITACRVVIEQPHHHHHGGRHFQVKIEVTLPGKVLAVTHDPSEHRNSEDPFASVNEAFGSMRRQLEDFVQRRDDVKDHGGKAS